MDVSEPALAKSVGTYDSRTGRLIWESTAIETLRVGLNKDIWFKGRDLATALGYKDAKVAVHDRVDAADKLPLQELMQKEERPALLRPRALSQCHGAAGHCTYKLASMKPALKHSGSQAFTRLAAMHSKAALLKAYQQPVPSSS